MPLILKYLHWSWACDEVRWTFVLLWYSTTESEFSCCSLETTTVEADKRSRLLKTTEGFINIIAVINARKIPRLMPMLGLIHIFRRRLLDYFLRRDCIQNNRKDSVSNCKSWLHAHLKEGFSFSYLLWLPIRCRRRDRPKIPREVPIQRSPFLCGVCCASKSAVRRFLNQPGFQQGASWAGGYASSLSFLLIGNRFALSLWFHCFMTWESWCPLGVKVLWRVTNRNETSSVFHSYKCSLISDLWMTCLVVNSWHLKIRVRAFWQNHAASWHLYFYWRRGRDTKKRCKDKPTGAPHL